MSEAKRMRGVRAGVAGCVALAGLAGGAGAGVTPTMTFQSLEHADGTVAMHGTMYEEIGFRLSNSSGEFQTWGTTAGFYPGSTALMTANASSIVTLEPVGGGTFDIFSMQIAKRDTATSIFPVNVTFTGVKSDSSTVMATFNGTVAGVVLQDFVFPASFTDLVEVRWQASQGHQFDNIALIPAPATLALLGAGGLLAARRRRG